MTSPDRDSTRAVLGCQGTRARRSSGTPSNVIRCARLTGAPPGGPRSASSSSHAPALSPSHQAARDPLSGAEVLAAVSAAWGLTGADISGPRRQRRLVQARHAVIYLARCHLAMSWSELASLVGCTDHTSAIWAYRRIAAGLTAGTDRQLLERLAWAARTLGIGPEAP